MSRKYDRSKKLNLAVLDILEDPATLHYLGSKIIRRKPKLMPRFVWRFFLFVVMAPSTRQTIYQGNRGVYSDRPEELKD